MKKSLMLVAALSSLIILSGCGGKKLNCEKNSDFPSSTLKSEVKVSFKDDYATKTETKLVAEFKNETNADSYAATYEGKEGYKVKKDKSGKKVTITYSSKVDKDEKKADENKYEKVKDIYESLGYTCK